MIDTTEVPGPDGVQVTTGFYWGKTGVTRRVHRAMLAESAKCDLIFGIDVIAKEGLDIPGLNTLIFATPPGVEIEQPVGRILRKFHLDLNPVVLDLVDNTGNYVSHFNTRRDWYLDENYIINEITVNLDAALDHKEISQFLLEKNDEKRCVKPRRRRPAVTAAAAREDIQEPEQLQMEEITLIDEKPGDCLF
jgi:superfamily II DNA or RNA helicase